MSLFVFNDNFMSQVFIHILNDYILIDNFICNLEKFSNIEPTFNKNLISTDIIEIQCNSDDNKAQYIKDINGNIMQIPFELRQLLLGYASNISMYQSVLNEMNAPTSLEIFNLRKKAKLIELENEYNAAQALYITQNNILFIYPLRGEYYKIDWMKQLGQGRAKNYADVIFDSYNITINNQILPYKKVFVGKWKKVIFNKIDDFADSNISIFNLKVKKKINQSIEESTTEEQLNAISTTGFKSGLADNTIDLGSICVDLLADPSVSQEDKDWVLTKYDQETGICSLVELA